MFLQSRLEGAGYQVDLFNTPEDLLTAHDTVPSNHPDLVFVDDCLTEVSLDDLLKRLSVIFPAAAIIVTSSLASVRKAVKALQLGARDYLIKPFMGEELNLAVSRVLERSLLEKENRSLKAELRRHFDPNQIIFKSREFHQVYTLALKVAKSDVGVLILGESGTGKELIASTIHYSSLRCKHRFMTINCAALTDTLLESQLFGHVKGAFTGAVTTQRGLLEEAHQGTLFLDEVGDLSPALQAKLLRVLQEKEYIPVGSTQVKHTDVRFVAATNKKLEDEVAAGRFRQDLYYRLNVAPLKLPALRDRRDDIQPLAEYFLQKHAAKANGFDPEAIRLLRRYDWPGNVRELENVLEMAILLADGRPISPEHLPVQIVDGTPLDFSLPQQQMTLDDMERIYIEQLFRHTGGHKLKTASILNISRKTLDRKLQQYGIS